MIRIKINKAIYDNWEEIKEKHFDIVRRKEWHQNHLDDGVRTPEDITRYIEEGND